MSKGTIKILTIITLLFLVDIIVAKINNPDIIFKKNLFRNYNSRTLPPFGIYVQKEDQNNQTLLKHEFVHWKQYRERGAILFYFQYLFEKQLYGYDKMPMEFEAREAVGESEYCTYNMTECVRTGKAKTITDKDFRT